MELNLFTYPGSTANDITYAANYALTDTSVTEISLIMRHQVGIQLDHTQNQ